MKLIRFFRMMMLILKSGAGRLRGIFRLCVWYAKSFFGAFPFLQIHNNSVLIARKENGSNALIYFMGLYDRNNMNLILRYFSSTGKGVFVDVGANIGSYTLLASELPEVHVYSCEPHPKTFAQLRYNIQLNHRTNVTPLNYAVGEKEGELQFSDSNESTINHVVSENSKNEKTITVPSSSLDVLLKEAESVDIVKIDVEGFEWFIISGAKTTLERAVIFLLELNDLDSRYDLNSSKTMELMKQSGYEGPYYFDCASNTFKTLKRKEDTREDWAFINKKFIGRVLEAGFKVE